MISRRVMVAPAKSKTSRVLESLSSLPRADQILPWAVHNISVYPFGKHWSPFNPSVHYDRHDDKWRCVVRCANYSLPGGVPVLSPEAKAGRAQTRNVMMDLDPQTLSPIGLCELREKQDLPIATSCPSNGVEDLRLFRTQRDGLVAVCCVLQHNLEHPSRPEIAICRFGEDKGGAYVKSLNLLRGPWSYQSQKNWVPFDGTDSVTLLYSIERGVVMGERGPLPGSPDPVISRPAQVNATKQYAAQANRFSSDVQIRPMQMHVWRPPAASLSRRTCEIGFSLRGSSQLVSVSSDRWLGIAHQMTFARLNQRKFYWHTLYTVDNSGKVAETSQPFRLSGDYGIEFAAGLAIDASGRAAISYGTDDHQAWIATTNVESLLKLLRPYTPDQEAAHDL